MFKSSFGTATMYLLESVLPAAACKLKMIEMILMIIVMTIGDDDDSILEAHSTRTS